MSLEGFQFIDNELIDDSIIKKDLLKLYHQQGGQLDQSDQIIEFIFGENNNFHQTGNGLLESVFTVRKNDNTNFPYDDAVPFLNNRYAFCFKEARLSTTIGSDIEHNIICGKVSTIMRVISKKDGDFLSQFDYIIENDIPILEKLQDLPPQFRDTTHQKLSISDLTHANKGKLKGCLYLEDMFDFCKCFKKVTKNLGFHLMLKSANLQDIIYTSLTDDINVTIINLCLIIRIFFTAVETQLSFNAATQKIYRITYDEYYTERRLILDMIVQVDIGSVQQFNSPRYLICAHQTRTRTDTPNKNNNIALIDNLDLRNYFVEIDRQRYTRERFFINYEEIDYIEQYIDLKTFFKEYIGELLLNPPISYTETKTKYPIELIELRHQPDKIALKKIQLCQEYGADPDNARLFLIIFRRREIVLISDGKKLIKVEVI